MSRPSCPQRGPVLRFSSAVGLLSPPLPYPGSERTMPHDKSALITLPWCHLLTGSSLVAPVVVASRSGLSAFRQWQSFPLLWQVPPSIASVTLTGHLAALYITASRRNQRLSSLCCPCFPPPPSPASTSDSSHIPCSLGYLIYDNSSVGRLSIYFT